MLILKVAYLVLFGLLTVKLLINLSIPFALFKKRVINKNTGETGGISFSPVLEALITLLALFIAYFINSERFFFSIKGTLYIFIGATILSYTITFIGVMLVGFIRSKRFNFFLNTREPT